MEISKDKTRIDVEYVHQYLTHSYWAAGRSREEIGVTIDNSICYSGFINEKQVAFARVVSDKQVFAYIMDVFVDPAMQGHGLGIQMMKYILEDAELQSVDKWLLATKDAHAFYHKLGFKALEHPERLMTISK